MKIFMIYISIFFSKITGTPPAGPGPPPRHPPRPPTPWRPSAASAPPAAPRRPPSAAPTANRWLNGGKKMGKTMEKPMGNGGWMVVEWWLNGGWMLVKMFFLLMSMIICLMLTSQAFCMAMKWGYQKSYWWPFGCNSLRFYWCTCVGLLTKHRWLQFYQ